MEKTLGEIATFIGGHVVGDPNIMITGLQGITEAGPSELTFIANPRYRRYLSTTKAAAILAPADMPDIGRPLIRVDDPYVAFARLLGWFYPEPPEEPVTKEGAVIAPDASVSPEAVVFPGAYVGPRAVIARGAILKPGVVIGSGVQIGEDTILHPRVVVYPRCIIGRRVIIHAGVVIGADGFGFAHPTQENIKIPQVGIVQIDDDVEIGANTTIDRATLGRTWIQKGVKIDNLVQIGHNVTIGERSIIVAQVGISGSVRIGRGVILGGQVGVVGHLEVGDGCIAAARSAIHNDVAAHQIVAGTPAIPHKKWLRAMGALPKLPDLLRKVSDLARRLTDLETYVKDRKP